MHRTGSDDEKLLVRRAYDEIFERYEAWDDDAVDDVRLRAFEVGLRLAPSRNRALDLGCGTGTKITRRVAEEFDHVTAVDISPRSIEAARGHLPGVDLRVGDMATVTFPAAGFDLVTAFFSIIHVPAAEQAPLFARIARWLVPGGVFLCNLGAEPGDQHEDFLGVPMFWSALAPSESIAAVERAGLEVLEHAVDARSEHGVDVSFLWLTSRRPRVS